MLSVNFATVAENRAPQTSMMYHLKSSVMSVFFCRGLNDALCTDNNWFTSGDNNEEDLLYEKDACVKEMDGEGFCDATNINMLLEFFYITLKLRIKVSILSPINNWENCMKFASLFCITVVIKARDSIISRRTGHPARVTKHQSVEVAVQVIVCCFVFFYICTHKSTFDIVAHVLKQPIQTVVLLTCSWHSQKS